MGEIITIIISAIALILSGWGVYFSLTANVRSKKANQLSEEALNQTKSHFIIQNRPYLNAELIPFKKDGQFFQFQQKEKSFIIGIRFKLTNKGAIPAKNISVAGPYEIAVDPSNSSHKTSMQIPSTISIGPEKSYVYNWNLEIGYGDYTAEDIKKQVQDKIFTADVSMTWKYTSALDENSTYKSSVSYVVKHDSVEVIKSEMN